MGLLSHAFRRHQFGGLLLVLLLLMAPHIPALSSNPLTLRDFSVVAFDVVFVVPLLVGAWRGRRRRRRQTGPVAAASSRRESAQDFRIRLRIIGLLGIVSFAVCYAAAPAAPVKPHDAWYSALQPFLDQVRYWSGSITAFEHKLRANGRPDDAVLAGDNLAMLWTISGLSVLWGFLWRWVAMDTGQAIRLCVSNRSWLSGTQVLRKVIDRCIVVLFVWNLPMAGVSNQAESRGFDGMAQTIEFLVTGLRGGTLLLLLCIGLEWLLAEVYLWKRGRWQKRWFRVKPPVDLIQTPPA